ncbi:MAG: helix-turn-helix domain-containing protein, partial [Syntrophales bacterium]|nr:helix-turn-helix domain-containing protein [Syntrophales bacterium]
MAREMNKAILENALNMTGRNKSKAARLLNISRYKFIRELNKVNGSMGERKEVFDYRTIRVKIARILFSLIWLSIVAFFGF